VSVIVAALLQAQAAGFKPSDILGTIQSRLLAAERRTAAPA
jgi:hypothetical protein